VVAARGQRSEHGAARTTTRETLRDEAAATSKEAEAEKRSATQKKGWMAKMAHRGRQEEEERMRPRRMTKAGEEDR